MNSQLLNKLYEKFDIASCSFGKVSDKLGDVYEAYCKKILENRKYLNIAKQNTVSKDNEYAIFKSILATCGITCFSNVKSIFCGEKVPKRSSHGPAKTDIIIDITYIDHTHKKIPISCKQSYAPSVALAEFSVDTICTEIGIQNNEIKELMLLHQIDGSAKTIKQHQAKNKLKELLSPYAEKFVRWVLTGSPTVSNNIAHPTFIVKFKVKRPAEKGKFDLSKGELHYESYNVYSMDEYIKKIRLTKKGKPRVAGFGTGLQWTYATGSKGKKIQFKG